MVQMGAVVRVEALLVLEQLLLLRYPFCHRYVSVFH